MILHLLFFALVTSASQIPAGPVRAAAEWDESQGVFCLWENPELMDELQKDGDVYIITENESWWLSWLASNSIPATNFKFLRAPTDSFWVRDYGPWFMWDGNGQFALADPYYYSVRPLDDAIPHKVSQVYGIPHHVIDLYHVGGNYYPDGYGAAWSSRMVYTGNTDKTPAQIDQIMHDFQGITRPVTPDLDYLGEHIDTYGKLLAPDTLIWGAFPENSSPWVFAEAAYKHFKTLQSPYGWPYKITRMPLWDVDGTWTAYINALQTNGKIIARRYDTPHDAEAKAIYEAAAPGYEVALVDAPGTYWGDAIHCRTRNFIKGDAIRIYPKPHWETADSETGPYEVLAEVIPHPGTSLSGNPVIRWTLTGGAPFNTVVMNATGNPDEFSGAIPLQPAGSVISYYLHAEDLPGRTRNYPLVAPAGMFTIKVEDDKTAPGIEHVALHGLTLADWPPTLKCTAIDNTGIPALLLEYEINGNPMADLPMVREEGTFVFSAAMTGTVALGDRISYRIKATDSAQPQNTARCPVLNWNHFTINPRNEVLVIELDALPDSGSVLHAVCDDLGLDAHFLSQWPASLDSFDAVMVCLGMSPKNVKLTTSQAHDLVSFLTSGGSAYMEGGNCWAQDTQKDVYLEYFGLAGATGGSQLTEKIDGVAGTMTEGMVFDYLGESNSSDHLTPVAAAETLLVSSGQTKAVAYSTGTYSTVAASFQIGSLTERDAPSHIKYLVARYLRHLGLDVDLVIHGKLDNTEKVALNLSGDPHAIFLLFFALGPGYHPYGNAGIVQLDPGTLGYLLSGIVPSDGEFVLNTNLPVHPSLQDVEVYFQGYAEDTGTGSFHLTNRDRLTFKME